MYPHGVSITDTATELGKLTGATGRYFSRGRTLVAMRHTEDGNPLLEVVKSAHFVSAIEEVAQPVRLTAGAGIRLVSCDYCTATVVRRLRFHHGGTENTELKMYYCNYLRLSNIQRMMFCTGGVVTDDLNSLLSNR